MASVTDAEIRDVMNEVEDLDLSDGAHWAMISERLGMEMFEVISRIGANPSFFGAVEE